MNDVPDNFTEVSGAAPDSGTQPSGLADSRTRPQETPGESEIAQTTPTSQTSPVGEKRSRSLLKTLSFVLLLVVIFVVVATATALGIMAKRGTLSLPWSKRPPGTQASPPLPSPGSEERTRRHDGLPSESSNGASSVPEDGAEQEHTGLFESELGYRTRLAPGWIVSQKARSGDDNSELDSFTNGKQDNDFASIQVISLGNSGIDPAAAASLVATKASSQQGYSIMVRPHKTRFGQFDAASFRAYTVQNGFPLIVDVFIVAGPHGQLLQVQFSSSLEGAVRQASEFSAFQQYFEFVG